ncbi:MAG: ribbon-helix-helix protein, CopG family [Candidatus Heimdallarchaeota archaeon]|nr:ribbon-helix-helix protein, CopG family [Candidatus Heimdallarchaeota archaeon]
MPNISVSLDDELLEWLDQLVERGVIKSRSEAVRGGSILIFGKNLG